MDRRNWHLGHRRVGAHGHVFGLWLGRAAGLAGGHRFGPFGGQGRFFESGQARLAVLSLLEEGPKHGYEIIKALEARSGGLYRASAGTVYPTLQLLEDEDLVVSKRQDGKKVYRLTTEGRREVERQTAEVKNIWQRAAQWEDWSKWMGPEAAMLMGPLGVLMKATFQAAARGAGDPRRVVRVRQILDHAIDEMSHVTDPAKNSR